MKQLEIKADKEYQQMILDFLEANTLEDFPDEVNVVYAVWIPVSDFSKKVDDVKKALASGLGVDIETVDEVDGGGSDSICLSTEIMVSRGEDIHAIDWILHHHDKINDKLKKLDLECGIIVED